MQSGKEMNDHSIRRRELREKKALLESITMIKHTLLNSGGKFDMNGKCPYPKYVIDDVFRQISPSSVDALKKQVNNLEEVCRQQGISQPSRCDISRLSRIIFNRAMKNRKSPLNGGD